ncbi:ATP-dependent DNA helicase [Trichonephila inaurata madagascariensis]|uniref:ATP-dependent DNA helicase n=1 Tax=Trichonephila inaurata madagascariensis TaxID=2747483 RepID=A0A8X6YEH4_9ARAC|nr:ATP-dependent DNA helicase [Trichonephila inaurata madagascariensis]
MIQGAAGTGKSFLINIIEQTLIRMFEKSDQDPSQPTVLKLAPTGKAASNIKEETLHHALGIGLSKNACLSGSSITEYAVKYANVKCVIFDEISMVASTRKGCSKQISGLSQLAPQMWHLTQYYELNEIMRQKDDKMYAELLNCLALGKLTDKDVELLRTKQTILEKVPKSATLLYHSIHDVDLANKIRLNSIEGPLVKSQAYDSVSETAPNGSKQKVLDKVQKFDRTKMGNLESVIKFKVGAKYMLTYNIDTVDGLVNGAVG